MLKYFRPAVVLLAAMLLTGCSGTRLVEPTTVAGCEVYHFADESWVMKSRNVNSYGIVEEAFEPKLIFLFMAIPEALSAAVEAISAAPMAESLAVTACPNPATESNMCSFIFADLAMGVTVSFSERAVYTEHLRERVRSYMVDSLCAE